MSTITVTASNGKQYLVAAPRAYSTVSRGIVVAYPYWGTRNGRQFGASRVATTADTGKVGRELVAAGQRHYGADHDAMIAAVAAREAAEQA